MFWGKQRSTSSPSRLCCSSFSVSVLNFATSPNSGVKLFWGFLRSEKSILRFIFSGCAFFSWFFIFFCDDCATTFLASQGTAPHHPRGTQPPHGMQANGTVLGPHTHTPAPTARGWQTPTARPVGGQSGEGQRLTSDAPHNGGRHPPRGRPSETPTASDAGLQGRTLWGPCWVPTPAPTASGTHGSRNPGRPPQRTGGRGRDSA